MPISTFTRFSRVIAGIGLLSTSSTFATTIVFSEDFESFVTDPMNFDSLVIPSGSSTDTVLGADVINSTGTFGVAVVQEALLVGFNQFLQLGGGNAAPINSVAYSIAGFTGATSANISFEHFVFPAPGQGTQVQVLDPNNSDAILFDSGELLANSSINSNFAALPTGDEVTLLITQTGDTSGSDTGVDDIVVSVVPEPTTALLVALSSSCFLRRRRNS